MNDEERMERHMMLENFIKFAKIANAIRYGTNSERAKMQNDPDVVKFMVELTDSGLLDSWIEACDQISGEGL